VLKDVSNGTRETSGAGKSDKRILRSLECRYYLITSLGAKGSMF
jgi:hypothetical protein